MAADMIQLVALDLDGTLLDSRGRLPRANLEALERAVDAGIDLVLATGRRYDYARPVFEQIPLPLTLILSNGAITKTPSGETLLRHLLPRAVAQSVLAAVPEHRETAALLFDRPREAQIVYERVDWDHPRDGAFFAANRPFIATQAPLEEALTEDPLQVMFTGGCAAMRRLFERLQTLGQSGRAAPAAAHAPGEAPGAAGHHGARAPVTARTDRPLAVVARGETPLTHEQYSVGLTEYLHRDFSLVDIIQAGCSKGTALRELAASRGIGRDAVMAMGDNLNDLQMLEFAGRPVVMGNGLPDLKAFGWRVAATNDEAGVARAIDEILAGRGGVQRTRSMTP